MLIHALLPPVYFVNGVRLWIQFTTEIIKPAFTSSTLSDLISTTKIIKQFHDPQHHLKTCMKGCQPLRMWPQVSRSSHHCQTIVWTNWNIPSTKMKADAFKGSWAYNLSLNFCFLDRYLYLPCTVCWSVGHATSSSLLYPLIRKSVQFLWQPRL